MTMGVAAILPRHPLRTSKLGSAELSKRRQRVVANLKKLLMSTPSVPLRTGDARLSTVRPFVATIRAFAHRGCSL